MASLDSFKCRRTLTAGGKTYTYYSLPDAEANGLAGIGDECLRHRRRLDPGHHHDRATVDDTDDVDVRCRDTTRHCATLGRRLALDVSEAGPGEDPEQEIGCGRDAVQAPQPRAAPAAAAVVSDPIVAPA